MIKLQGAYTALVTPFTGDGASVDHARLRANIDQQAAGGISGVVPCGTTGETPTLSTDEHLAVVATTVAQARSHELTVIAGAGSNSTAHAVALHRQVEDAGADAALHVTPYYNKPSQEGLYRHFMSIADASDLPVVLYNIPGRTGVLMKLDTIERLAVHPNIVAVKDATGSLDLVEPIAARKDLVVLSGDDPLTLPMMLLGATGVVSVVSNLVPKDVAELCAAALAGNWDVARDRHRRLAPLSRALLGLDTNPIPIKTAMQRAGRDTGAMRLPLCAPSAEALRAIDHLVATALSETPTAGTASTRAAIPAHAT